MPRFMLTIHGSAWCSQGSQRQRTGGIHGHPKVFDDTVFSKDLAHMVFFDVSSQGFYYDLLEHQRPYSSKAGLQVNLKSCLSWLLFAYLGTPGGWRPISRRRTARIAPPS